MRAPLLRNLRPTSGIAHVLHLALLVVLPAAVFILVRLHFVQPALSIIVLSKWRMFAVRPRFWPSNIRANAVDLMVGLSVVLFMTHAANHVWLQLLYAALYAVWLIAIKPALGLGMITAQAFIGQFVALTALYAMWVNGPLYGLTLGTGLICYLAARHYFDAFEEPYSQFLAYVWGYFGAALAWLLSHWLLLYRGIAQPTLLLTVIGYGLGGLYYLDHHERLDKGLRRQLVLIMVAIVIIVLAFSDWGDKVV